jgi:hypothetical protein
VALYPNVASFADNRFDRCDLLQRNVIHHRTGKASGIKNVGDVEHHDRPAIVARLLHELPRSCEVVLHHRLGTDRRGVRATACKYFTDVFI